MINFYSNVLLTVCFFITNFDRQTRSCGARPSGLRFTSWIQLGLIKLGEPLGGRGGGGGYQNDSGGPGGDGREGGGSPEQHTNSRQNNADTSQDWKRRKRFGELVSAPTVLQIDINLVRLHSIASLFLLSTDINKEDMHRSRYAPAHKY